MPATFDDFIDLADARVQQAAMSVTDGARISAATCAALSTATRSLLALGTRYGATANSTPVTVWQPVFLDLLTAADRRLRRHAGSTAAPTSTDDLINEAARFVTIAQDLLATHLTVPDPPRAFAHTPQGTELLDAPVREHLLRRAAELTGHLAELTRTVATFDDLPRTRPGAADAYRPRHRDLADAARDLADAAAHSPGPAPVRLELEPAPVLAAPLAYPQPNEEPAHVAAQIRDDLERLATAAYRAARRLDTGEHPPVHTASDLRAAAKSLAVCHLLAADLLTRVAPHLPGPGSMLTDGADRLRAAAAAWARLRDPWQQTASAPDGGPRSPLTVQVTSVAVRLGRLLYADPAWEPRSGPGTPHTLDDLLAHDALDAICLTISALPRAAATIAANHARLVADGVLDLYSNNRADRPEAAARRFYPLQPAQRARFAADYRQAATASKTAAADLAPLSRGYQPLKTAALISPGRRAAGLSLGAARDPLSHRSQQRHVDSRPPTPRQ